MNKKFKVGILSLYQRPYHDQLLGLLIDQLNAWSGVKYSLLPYRVTLSDDEIREAAVALIQRRNCDVVVTIGEACSLRAKEAIADLGGHKMIFVGVRDPLGVGLVKSLEAPGFMITGVARQNAPLDLLGHHLKKFMPGVHQFLIPYSPLAGRLEKEALATKRVLTEAGATVFTVPINEDENSVMSIVASYSEQVQAVVLLEGCYSNQLQEELADFCWERCLVSVGSGPSAIEAGLCASFTTGVHELAGKTYEKLESFCQEDGAPKEVAVSVLQDDRFFEVNIDTMRRINFPNDELARICSYPDTKVVRKCIIRRK